ncbi:MAG TPA: tetratricopeptide repeat protein [Candidatus Dormibacteraeota bacterium]|nr:tetratricopeptide repeat protein [Candidatus Dormibacteraeota bacterium]
MSDLPTGTVTFFFSDIEGSTRLIQQLGADYPQALLAHHAIQRQVLAANGGHELRTEGDSFFIVFASALQACATAAAVQRQLAAHAWPKGSQVRVRIGLHTGEATLLGNEYLGIDVHRAARVASAAHGGQVLVSDTTRVLAEQALPPDLHLKDLGVHRLKDLARPERLFQLSIDGCQSEFPALRTLESTPNNLPTQMTSFIGRDDQVRDAKELLEKSRLLTLTGPGGTGKTRLSLRIAADLLDRFPDGVYFVPLAAIHDPELVPSTIAQALSIQTSGNRRPIEALADYLHDKQALLILDNFEQLMPAAPVATRLLEAGPKLRVIVSSRTVLRVYGEQEYQVPPLAIPDLKSLPGLAALSQFEGVRLFIERAIAVKPDFQATNDNAPAIAGICQRVDGLPLAIELAAARVKLFAPQALLNRLEKSMSVLGTGARDLPGRQQTLRGAIQWSYDLLDANGQRLLARCSVFARSGSLEQLEAVCGPAEEVGAEVVEALDQLADQSLLRRLPDYSEPRFLMLQTIREFAADRLTEVGESERIQRRHLEAFTALARESQAHLFGAEGREWLDRLEIDHDNVRAALEWAIAAGDARAAMELAASFWRYWQMRGHLHEARRRLTAVLAMPNSAAFPKERLAALEAAGGVAYWQADMEQAQRIYTECLEMTRVLGDDRAVGNALYNAAFPRIFASASAERAEALRLLAEALLLFRKVADETGVARVLWGTGNVYYFGGDYAAALPILQESEALWRKIDDRFGLAWSLHTLGLVALHMGDVERARQAWIDAVRLFVAAGDVSGLILQLDNFSALALRKREFVRAARLWGASRNLQETSGTGLVRLSRGDEGRTGREGLREEEAATAWADGQALSLDEAVAYALEEAPTKIATAT